MGVCCPGIGENPSQRPFATGSEFSGTDSVASSAAVCLTSWSEADLAGGPPSQRGRRQDRAAWLTEAAWHRLGSLMMKSSAKSTRS